jgi:transposase
MPGRIDPAVRERGLRMIADHRQDYPSDTALAAAVAAAVAGSEHRSGDGTSLAGAGQHQRRARPGTTSDEQAELKRLKAENKRLREDEEILRAATVFFAGELDPRNR